MLMACTMHNANACILNADNISMQQYEQQLAYTMQMATNIHNAMNNMVYTMLNGLKPKWMGLSHTQISGHMMEMRQPKYMQTCTDAKDRS